MKYCPACSGSLTQINETHFHCRHCGGDHYVNPKGAAAVILLKNNQIAYLATRAYEPHKGKLDCLGGFLDVGENYEQAAYRELREEAGITPEDIFGLEYLTSTYDPYPWQNGITHTASVYFLATLRTGAAMSPNDDVAKIEEFDLHDLTAEDFAWDGMRQAFEVLTECLSKT